jgi:hypothetical protein
MVKRCFRQISKANQAPGTLVGVLRVTSVLVVLYWVASQIQGLCLVRLRQRADVPLLGYSYNPFQVLISIKGE